MDNVIVGRAFCGFRKSDDRLFLGVVESVRKIGENRTFVVIHCVESTDNGGCHTVYKSFDLENMRDYSCIVTDYWPEGKTRRDMLESVGAT